MIAWAIALVGIVVSVILSVSGSAIAIAYTSGRFTQKLDSHTHDDERRFSELSGSLVIIQADIKEILKRRRR